jgi:hypothetical protein
MRYLKLYEKFILEGQTQAQAQPQQTPGRAPETDQKPGRAPQIEPDKSGQRNSIASQELFSVVKSKLSESLNDPKVSGLFNKMVEDISWFNQEKLANLFQNIYISSKALDEEYKGKTYENLDLNQMAKDALFYLVTVGIMGAAVKLFFMLGEMVFQELNKGGFYSVAGGVLLILLYLAFQKKGQKVSNEKDIEEINEKRSKKEGEETLRASSFAYVPDKDKPSTWKLRIDDATHVRSAVAALGKGFRGNKVEIPADEKDSVIRKVRKAYKKFYPEIVSEDGYPKALELK